MVGGGLMQLVAYGAQDIDLSYICNEVRHKKKIRFFYDKIKNKKKPANIYITQQQIFKPTDPGYVYDTVKPKYKPIPIASKTIAITNPIRKLFCSPIKRARNNFGWRKVYHLHQFIITKLIPFNNTFWEIVNKPKLANNITIIEGINRIVQTIKKHVCMINELDITNHIIINRINNIECPITYKEITNQYIECSNCKMCYDYADTIDWFESRKCCCYCTLPICIKPIDIQYNQIYKYLRS